MTEPNIDRFADAELEHRLAQWLPHQRWFAAKGSTITGVRILLRQPLAGAAEFEAEHLLVSVEFDAAPRQIYQVPLGFRRELSEELTPWALFTPDRGTQAGSVAYDGMRDSEIIALYADVLAARKGYGPMRARTVPGTVIEPGLRGRALGAEQSNTSVVLGEQLLLKIFRRLTPGISPDVELHLALGEVDCTSVARLRAWIEGEVDGVLTTFAMVQDFEANAADGWAMALGSVRDLFMEADLHADEVGTDFASESHRMGAAVADVHAALACSLGTEEKPVTAITVDAMSTRLDAACAIVPELVGLAPAVRERFTEAASTGSATVQRIHGDLHLGQLLRTPDRWLLIDFEGEPAKTLAQRREPDSALRDVAGMLRSFDYAAHHPLGEPSSVDVATQRAYRAREWAQRNGDAFCDGYASTAGSDPRVSPELLRAYELDKAVYETVYEARNRPSWIGLPLEAIRRLTA